MTRIAIAGAAGRMGRNLVVACGETDDIELTQALEREHSPSLGTDSGILAGLAQNHILLSDQLDAQAFDLLIDFTHPSATTRPSTSARSVTARAGSVLPLRTISWLMRLISGTRTRTF